MERIDTETYTLHRGTAPLLISLPHQGTAIPDDLRARFTPLALTVPDTDWHVETLYAFAADTLDASILVPKHSRYVIDLNRPRDGAALYPGRNETGLIPQTTFSGQPIYQNPASVSAEETARRIDLFWKPYHAALTEEIARLHARHGRIVLWEGHSIKSQVPLFFPGVLPDFNLGTADGRSCDAALQRRLEAALRAQTEFTHVANGRFKGGYITRHYARPQESIHAVQLELSQKTYMDETSFAFLEALAVRARSLIQILLRTCLE